MSHPTIRTLVGGLKTSVFPMNGEDLIHQSALGKSLYDLVEHEAKAHQADFNGANFNKIIEAVKANKIQAWFIVAGWEQCLPRVLGAAVEFPTVFTEWDGNEFKHYPGVYGEDTCIQPKVLRELIKERPSNKSFPPDLGLGLYFEQERMRLMRAENSPYYGMTPKGRIGEVSAHSTNMLRLLDQFGSEIGAEQEDPILEMQGITSTMRNRLPVAVEVQSLTPDSDSLATLSNVFVASWASDDEKQRLAASFPEAFSTFTGENIVRVQLTSNGNLPYGDKLKEVLSSLLIAGEEEVRERRWGKPALHKQLKPRSPIIYIHAPPSERLKAVWDSNKEDLLHPRLGLEPELFLGGPPPLMRIHAIGEKEVVKALKGMGLQDRMLGPHVMQPASLDLGKMPVDIMELNPPQPKPLNVIRQQASAYIPLFSLAA